MILQQPRVESEFCQASASRIPDTKIKLLHVQNESCDESDLLIGSSNGDGTNEVKKAKHADKEAKLKVLSQQPLARLLGNISATDKRATRRPGLQELTNSQLQQITQNAERTF